MPPYDIYLKFTSSSTLTNNYYIVIYVLFLLLQLLACDVTYIYPITLYADCNDDVPLYERHLHCMLCKKPRIIHLDVQQNINKKLFSYIFIHYLHWARQSITISF